MIKKKSTSYLLLILLFGTLIRLYFFMKTYSQPIWWDEGENLVRALSFYGLSPTTGILSIREIGMPLVWGLLFKIGFSEALIRFSLVLLSILDIFLIYLVGKELFNEEVGLISAFFLSLFTHHLFYSMRFLMEIPALTFVLLTTLFFWKGMINKGPRKYIYFSALFFCLGIFVYYSVALILPVLMLTYFIIHGKNSFSKQLFTFCLALLIFYLPYGVYNEITTDHFTPARLTFTGAMEENKANDYSLATSFIFFYLPIMLHRTLGILCVLALIYALIISYIYLPEKKVFGPVFFSILSILFIVGFQTVISISIAHAEDRYVMNAFPFIFFLIGYMLIAAYQAITPKAIGIVLIFLVLGLSLIEQVSFANQLITQKATSFQHVKESALWIKDHSNADDIIISPYVPYITYYARREAVKPPETLPFSLPARTRYYTYYPGDPEHKSWETSYFSALNPVPVHVISSQGQPIAVVFSIPTQEQQARAQAQQETSQAPPTVPLTSSPWTPRLS